jgi:hypothetical protein
VRPWVTRSSAILLALSSLALSSNLDATTIYVATTGSDSNAGTQRAPLQTIQRGVDLAKPGDTVSVADGTYGPNGHYTCGNTCGGSYNAPVTFWKSGTATAPITVIAENKWGAVLDCQLPYGYAGDGKDGVKACNAYFDFQGTASWIVIRNFDITRDYWVGAMVNATNSHIIFSGNHFHHIGNRIYRVPGGTTSYGIAGVYAGSRSSYITWDSNEFNNIGRLPQSGERPGGLGSDLRATFNYRDDYSHDHGLYIYNGPYTVVNNIFYSQAAGWNIQSSPGSHDISILNNTMIGGANPQKDGCMILWGRNTNMTIANNIFYNGRNYAIDSLAFNPSGVFIDHNIVYGSPSGVVSGRGVTVTNNSLNTDPLFVSTSTNNYHLRVGSPAIHSGAAVEITNDFDGNPRPRGAAIDAGAYEFDGTVRTPAGRPRHADGKRGDQSHLDHK